jgi:uncharacterized membrane protein
MALSRTTGWTIGLSLLGVLVAGLGVRFWAHDALPYITDYTEETYRRYWPTRQSLLVHIAGGTLALFAGPFQIWSGLRRYSWRLHRRIGYVYVSGITVAAVSSFSLAFHTRPDFGLSLAILSAAWLTTTAMALMAVRNKRIDAHREWMIRSYIVTFSFVSYRFLVDLSAFDGLEGGRFATVLWISWVVPMMLFELFVQWDRVRPLRRPATPAARAVRRGRPAGPP